MLNPRYLDGLSDELNEIYNQLEIDILRDMAKRTQRIFSRVDTKNPKAINPLINANEWQAMIIAETGGLHQKIRQILRFYSPEIQNEIERLCIEAMKKNLSNDNAVFKEATGRIVSENNAQAMLNLVQKCHSDLSNLTGSSADESQQAFLQSTSRAFVQVWSGAFDYDTAIKRELNDLADEGVKCVINQQGKRMKYSLESAVRMNIVTAINHTAANQTLNNCEELGCDLVETSAHAGARPGHEDWQGQIFSLSGKDKRYRPFSVCGLGTADGICGINCRHSYYPYFEGMERHYDKEALDALKKKEYAYTSQDGVKHEYTRYEAEQAQRRIERQIRRYKKRIATFEAAGLANPEAKQKLGEWQAVARDFTKQTGLRRDYTREHIGVERNLFNQRQAQSRGTCSKETGTAQTGGNFGGILDKSQEEQDKFAQNYYLEMKNRKSKSDIAKIAKNTNIKSKNVATARAHLFETETHLMANGERRAFSPSAEIALAWQRLENGQFTQTDILLLKHELTEANLMKKYGYCYEKAHLLSNLQYPWEYKIKERFKDLDDDEIHEIIRRLLKDYL